RGFMILTLPPADGATGPPPKGDNSLVTLGDVKRTLYEYRESGEFLPERLSETALSATYGPGTMAPESQFPAGIYNHPPTMQDAAAFAGIAPSSMSLVQSILARNAAETPLPRMTFLLTGR